MIPWLLGGDLHPEGSLVFVTPAWQIVLAVAAGAVAWIAAALRSRARGLRVLEMTLWTIGIGGVVFSLAGPTWLEEEGRREEGRVIVLVDGSASMGVVEDSIPRSAAVDSVIEHVRDTVGEPLIYHFGSDLGLGLPTSYDLEGTDLEGALDALSERVAGERLSSLVVISDGLDRGLLRRRYQADRAAAAPPELPGPLTVFQAGASDELIDLSVRSLDVGGFAFIRAPFRLTAHLVGHGLGGRTVTANLSADGAPLMSKTVKLDDDGNAEVVFEVTPSEAGRFAYTVSVPAYEGDAVPSNDSLSTVVRVVRDRIRVLQVAGTPGWDVKFLRRFLKGDPSVQLVSFFILRTHSDSLSAYDEDELSLIQFPYERLFDQDLWSFDVVVFQNFDYAPYFGYRGRQLLQNLKRYVEDGGALVMVGGDRSFGLGSYEGTPIGDVLPVKFVNKGTPIPEAFRPQLTDDGARHPVTRLVADPGENVDWWNRLPAMDGTNRVSGLHKDAAALLVHPKEKGADGEPLPILSVREVGKGRTMALTVDASWRWSLSEAAEGRGNQSYLRFWKNSIRWLMKDASTTRVSVDVGRENVLVGDEVRVVVRAREPGFGPLEGAPVSLEIQGPGGVESFEGETTPDGELVVTVEPKRSGTHRVVAMVGEAGRIGTAQTVFAASSRDPETDEIVPDAEFLGWLTASTSGRLHAPGELGPVLTDPDAGRTVLERHETALWRAPLLGLISLLALGFAWFVRRRAGLR